MTATSQAQTYASDQVLVMAANIHLEGGRGDSDFVTITPAGPDFTTKRGSDGSTVFNRSNNKGVTAKIKCMHTSQINTDLTQLRNLGLATPNGAPFLFEVRDLNNGALVCSGAKSMIMGPPEMVYGSEVSDREWTIEVASADLDASGYPVV